MQRETKDSNPFLKIELLKWNYQHKENSHYDTYRSNTNMHQKVVCYTRNSIKKRVLVFLFIPLFKCFYLNIFFASAAYAYQGNIEGTVLILPIFTFFALSLCVLPATISATIRRLHDIGKSGLYFFLSFIPVLGTLILLYFLVQPTKEDSSYKEEDDDLL